MTIQRITIATGAFSLILAVIWIDYSARTHLATFAVITAIGLLAQAEIYPLLRRLGLDSSPAYGMVAALLLFSWRGLGGFAGLSQVEVQAVERALLALVVVCPFLAVMFRGGPTTPGAREDFERIAVTLLGLFSVWFLFSFLLELRMLIGEDGTTLRGLYLTVTLVLSVKVGDSAAYLVGRSFGVTPLTWVSPKKTWEGAGASVAAGIVTAVVLGLVFGETWWHMVLFGLLTNVAGQLGDLVESLLKRRSGVKDSGNFLKEIGGFLDLIDSLLLAAPVGYLFARVVVL